MPTLRLPTLPPKMERMMRPLALAGSALGAFGILCAILLLTAGANTATNGIQLLAVDTTTLGTQVTAWLQSKLLQVGVTPENVHVDFVPGAVRRVYYMGDVAGTLAGNTSLTYDVLGQTLPPKTYKNDVWGTEWMAISVSNGSGSAPITRVGTDNDAWDQIDGAWQRVIRDTVAWNRTDSATINPQPAAGMIITGTILQAGAVAALVAIGLGALVLERKRGLQLAGLATLGALLNLASAAYITQVLRSYGGGAAIRYNSIADPIAIVPYSTSAAFWALTWLNAFCTILVADSAVVVALVTLRLNPARNLGEKEIHDEA